MPAKSKKQQRYMGMLYHCKETGDCPDKETKEKAKKIKKKVVREFAGTKHKGLPNKIKKKKRKKKKRSNMINELIKLATHLDERGHHREANYLDKIIKESRSEMANVEVQYQVREGDSWWSITEANSPGRRPEENAELNGMKLSDVIHPCQMLTIWSIPEYEGGAMNMNCLEEQR